LNKKAYPIPALVHKRLRVAVLYPGSLQEGWASLAIHALLQQVNAYPEAVAEPVFAPGKKSGPIRSYVSKRGLLDFDLILCSLSFEQQWVMLPHLLSLSGIPARQKERGETHPIVIAGGVAVRLNPRPGLVFLDAIVPGDSEAVIHALLDVTSRERCNPACCQALDRIEGVLAQPFENRETRAVFADAVAPVCQVVQNAGSMFSDMFLVETGRGCPAGCRFCALGFSRRPATFFSPTEIFDAVSVVAKTGNRIGLVGASLGRHPQLPEIVDRLASGGADLSPASLDPMLLSSASGRTLVDHLSQSGQRTIALAPEVGSLRLGRVINKAVHKDVMEHAIRCLGEAGIVNIKLYMMYGLPFEEPDDLMASVDLVSHVRAWLSEAHKKRGGTGRVSVSINPFVPKPHTPFELEAMPRLGELKRKNRMLRSRMDRIGGVRVSGYSPRQALLQCMLDRADESISDLLLRCEGEWPGYGFAKKHMPDLLERVHSPLLTGLPPWQMIDCGVDPDFLKRERSRAARGKITPMCSHERCGSCNSCSGLTIPPNR
jgi:radical SAM superfamily enzyme YgiQ (UPF0313 family)